jgi:hypothetical protein
MHEREYAANDRVVHRTRPEWGVGKVMTATPESQGGRAAQRLTIRFDRAGLKTLSTLHADLAPAPDSAAVGAGDGWLADLERKTDDDVMAKLPDEATDPFRSLEARLKFTLELYTRFGGSGRALIDWAAIQSGLADPLSRFNRQELEQLYKRFEFERDQHLKKLAADARRLQPDLLARLAPSAPPAARASLR